MNPGKNTIDWLKNEQLHIDPEWMIETPKGLTWWPGRHAQHIEVAGRETGPDGDVADYVRIRTDFLRNCQLNPRLNAGINLIMKNCTMSGPVFDKQTGDLGLCSIVRVHEGIRGWMAPLLSVAAMLQVLEAQNLAPMVAELAGVQTAESGHPDSGTREEPDELVGGFSGILEETGDAESAWRASEFESALNQYMQGPPALMASGGGAGLTVEFPYGDFSSLCQFKGDEAHPIIGKGLLIKQTFPFHNLEENKTTNAALEMNRGELSKRPAGYGFGSYRHDGSCLHFTCFIPNAAYRAGFLPNLYFACAGRAQALSAVFTKNDWSTPRSAPSQTKARPKSALERMMDFFK
jgi:hypothetical protein